MRRAWRQGIVAVCALTGVCGALRAQDEMPHLDMGTPRIQMPGQAQPQPVGTVTGRVIAEDTQHPARLASVTLFPVPQADKDDSTRRPLPWIIARTGPDGTFTATGRPGDYYVVASAPGYLSAQGIAQEALAAGQTVDQVMARLPMVHVSADGIAQVSVSIVRGASVSGQVTWEDGTPASGVPVSLVAATPVKLPDVLANISISSMEIQHVMMTDDRGRFRLTGIAAGEYYVQAMLNMRSPAAQFSQVMVNASMEIYAPGVARRSEAKSIKVSRGEDRDDLHIVLDLGKLHTVSGHVSGLPGPGTLATAGSLFLRDTQEQSLNRTSPILADGTFKLMYVPSGTYTVSVSARGLNTVVAGPPEERRGRLPRVSTTNLQQSITVGDTDVTGLELTVPPPTTATASAQ